ncbi:MAG: hypothetical protein PHX84_01720 [Candidatus Shapirobacteria bacterium]|jgi:hypothetical protein|nr:hypothetical protein [Candidatus Shapirobacteria bacterium]
MQTIEQLIQELKLTPEQSNGVKDYINGLLVELLESIKQDHIKNFDETINNLKNN